MQILYLDEVESTQLYLKNLILKNELQTPLAVSAQTQTQGIGSRENHWNSYNGNLFLSFAIPLQDLPKDLSLASASIYFAYLLKEILAENYHSKVYLKWPNDFYLESYKVGGMITHVVKDFLICGVGLNLKKAPQNCAILDVSVVREKLLEEYFQNIEKKPLWKKVFSKYRLEFHLSHKFFTHSNNKKIPLSQAVLLEDGSIDINGERIYSLR